MEGLKLIPYIFLVLAIAGVIGGATVVTMSKFGDTMTPCYNSSYTLNTSSNDFCINNTAVGGGGGIAPGKDNLNVTDQYYTKIKGVQGLGDVAEQLPTVAIISVMVIIISIIAGVFVYLRYFN